ncbi:MAG: glutamine-hydrolyzing carbamoyl-phosphate synthase small subunit [Nitrosomonadales bacterium]
MSDSQPAILILKDGTEFHGKSFGAKLNSAGEVVFNTSMTGYQEILTDPSYTEQIVTLTYPHIGNVGTNLEDFESENVYVKGLIIKDLAAVASNFRSTQDLSAFLKQHQIAAISDIDTRKLTRHIRKFGAQSGVIITKNLARIDRKSLFNDVIEMAGLDLAKVVTTKKTYQFDEGEWSLSNGFEAKVKKTFKVIAYDFGVKKNILRMLTSRGCDVTVVPATMTAEEVLKLNPDGVFLSNGPGDPEPCSYAIQNIQVLIDKKIPLFGICLGHQLLALASGAKTKKMKFGHHGANHPVQDLKTKKVFITSQNHGFTVDENSLPDNLELTHRSLFDGTIQGIRLKNNLGFSFQGHPEASPGPTEMSYLFDQFIFLMKNKGS